jgi:hypothetical protein
VWFSPRTRRAVAFLGIALIVFAAVAPTAAAHLVSAILTPLWLVVLAVTITVVRRRASRCDAQPVALMALVPFRAPPQDLALA